MKDNLYGLSERHRRILEHGVRGGDGDTLTLPSTSKECNAKATDNIKKAQDIAKAADGEGRGFTAEERKTVTDLFEEARRSSVTATSSTATRRSRAKSTTSAVASPVSTPDHGCPAAQRVVTRASPSGSGSSTTTASRRGWSRSLPVVGCRARRPASSRRPSRWAPSRRSSPAVTRARPDRWSGRTSSVSRTRACTGVRCGSVRCCRRARPRATPSSSSGSSSRPTRRRPSRKPRAHRLAPHRVTSSGPSPNRRMSSSGSPSRSRRSPTGCPPPSARSPMRLRSERSSTRSCSTASRRRSRTRSCKATGPVRTSPGSCTRAAPRPWASRM